jgi:hypothetical protein
MVILRRVEAQLTRQLTSARREGAFQLQNRSGGLASVRRITRATRQQRDPWSLAWSAVESRQLRSWSREWRAR